MQSSLAMEGAQNTGVQLNCGQPVAHDLQALTAVELVRLCLSSGSEAGWCEFVRRFQPVIASAIVKTLRRWTNPQPSLVDDLVQETYLKLCVGNFKALREFEFVHEMALYGYLKIIASNVVQDHFRRCGCQKRGGGQFQEDVELMSAKIPSPVDYAKRAQQMVLFHRIQECLKKRTFDPHFRRNYAIFWLYFGEGFSAKAISRLPGIHLSEKGVEGALQRVRHIVRSALRIHSPGAKAS